MAANLKRADVIQKDVNVSNLFLKLYFDHKKWRIIDVICHVFCAISKL